MRHLSQNHPDSPIKEQCQRCGAERLIHRTQKGRVYPRPWRSEQDGYWPLAPSCKTGPQAQ